MVRPRNNHDGEIRIRLLDTIWHGRLINTYQSYPIESEKGRYIGMFWGIFNMVGVRTDE